MYLASLVGVTAQLYIYISCLDMCVYISLLLAIESTDLNLCKQKKQWKRKKLKQILDISRTDKKNILETSDKGNDVISRHDINKSRFQLLFIFLSPSLSFSAFSSTLPLARHGFSTFKWSQWVILWWFCVRWGSCWES